MPQAWVSISNSDNKLSQQKWSTFCAKLVGYMASIGKLHGAWYSLTNEPWQNMAATAEIQDADVEMLRRELGRLAFEYRQDSIALQVGVAELILPINPKAGA